MAFASLKETIKSWFVSEPLGIEHGGTGSNSVDVVSKIEKLESAWDSVSHVIKTGTSGIWTYRKWDDGTAECWGAYRWSLTSTGNYWWGTISLPFTFYKAANSSAGLSISLGGGAYTVTTLYTSNFYSESSITSFKTAAVNVTATGTYDVYYYVIGAWK